MEPQNEPLNLALSKKRAEKTPPEATIKNNRFYLRRYDDHPALDFTALVDKDGNPAACPIQPPVLLPGNLTGQLELRHKPCTSECLFFVTRLKEPGTVHHICTGKAVRYDQYTEKKGLFL